MRVEKCTSIGESLDAEVLLTQATAELGCKKQHTMLSPLHKHPVAVHCTQNLRTDWCVVNDNSQQYGLLKTAGVLAPSS